STVSGRPRSWPSCSGGVLLRSDRTRPIAMRSAATTAPAPAATAPAATPARPVTRRQLAIAPPAGRRQGAADPAGELLVPAGAGPCPYATSGEVRGSRAVKVVTPSYGVGATAAA